MATASAHDVRSQLNRPIRTWVLGVRRLFSNESAAHAPTSTAPTAAVQGVPRRQAPTDKDHITNVGSPPPAIEHVSTIRDNLITASLEILPFPDLSSAPPASPIIVIPEEAPSQQNGDKKEVEDKWQDQEKTILAQELPTTTAHVNFPRSLPTKSTQHILPPSTHEVLPHTDTEDSLWLSSQSSRQKTLSPDSPQTDLGRRLSTLGSRNPWRNHLLAASGQSPQNQLGGPVPRLDGFQRQEEEAEGDTPIYTGSHSARSRASNQDDEFPEPTSTICTASTPRSSANQSSIASTNPSSLPESNVGVAAPLDRLVEITFRTDLVERVGKDYFMDRRAIIPDAIVQEWNQHIKPRFEEDLQKIIGNISARTGYILSNTEFYMVGTHHGNVLLAQPTIVITCGTKPCEKKVRRSLEKSKLHYLENFGQPIKVRYQRPPAYWAALTMEESPSLTLNIEENPSEAVAPTVSALHHVWAGHELNENAMDSTHCGRRLKVYAMHDGSVKQIYATLGGLVYVAGGWYAMTTAHKLHTDCSVLESQRQNPNLEDADCVSLSYGSDTDSESSEHAYFPENDFLLNPPGVNGDPFLLKASTLYSFRATEALWSASASVDPAFICFGGSLFVTTPTTPVSTANMAAKYVKVTSSPSMADWALFAIPHASFLPNRNSGIDLSEVVPEAMLTAGNVKILCGNRHSIGYLTQTDASLQTRDGIMNVREIVLDEPLNSAASGSWVVRGCKVYGYIIAVTGW